MEAILVLLAASLALLAGVLVASGMFGGPFGRATGEHPVCSRCARDARTARLAGRACDCGADLARTGAVRLVGVRRSGRRVGVGLLCAAAALGTLLVGLANARAGLRAVDRAPLWVLSTGLASSAEWARASLLRRIESGRVDAESAPTIVAAVNRGIEAAERGDTRPLRLGLAAERLAFLLPPESPLAADFARLTMPHRFERSGDGTARPGDAVRFRLRSDDLADFDEIDLRFHRIDEVTIGDRPVAWRVEGDGRPTAAWSERIMFLTFDELVITLPSDLPSGRQRLRVTLESGWCDLALEAVASPEPPSAWRTGVRSARLELTIELTVDGQRTEESK